MKRISSSIRILTIIILFSLINIFVFSNALAYARRTVVHHRGGGTVVHRGHGHHRVATTKVIVLPSGCFTIYKSGITYKRCGSVYYKPYYEGNTIVYVVVEKP